jgi:hypothetical protein
MTLFNNKITYLTFDFLEFKNNYERHFCPSLIVSWGREENSGGAKKKKKPIAVKMNLCL